jgi:23S rRNA (cytosine1962-C5)-methyltransferase
MAEPGNMFENRLRKNARHFRKWAARQKLTAYRIYDRDIPEYPFVVEWYAGRVHLAEYPRRRALKEGNLGSQREEALAVVVSVLEVPKENVYVKTHLPQKWGETQYGREGKGHETFEVEEQGLKFWVNLGDFLDTGLFLDHRNTRAQVREEARGKHFLNLFAYTGSFTVYAAAGGAASTTTVDLSNRYCTWAEDNLELNGFRGAQHKVIRADVKAWLESAPKGQFDLIVLDPPSFSTSKRMAGTFDVQRDQVKLVQSVLELAAPGGVLYFSTNFQGFELNERAFEGTEWKELTPGSIPDDFHFRTIHRCWRAQRTA